MFFKNVDLPSGVTARAGPLSKNDIAQCELADFSSPALPPTFPSCKHLNLILQYSAVC